MFGDAVIMTKSLQEFIQLIWGMYNISELWAEFNLEFSVDDSCYTHHRHLVLLSPKAHTHLEVVE